MQLVMHLLSLTNLDMEYCSSELFDKAAAPRNDSNINQFFKNRRLALFLTQKNQERREVYSIKVIAEW
jgi:hypothetical protein